MSKLLNTERSVSSKVGSADLFEAIGINFDKNLDESFESIDSRETYHFFLRHIFINL